MGDEQYKTGAINALSLNFHSSYT